jgi:hydroxymethylpyrimidine pyrophosphatase-like HAD family hydrolase
MLQEVGLGIAMGQAAPHIQQAAAWVTSTNDEDGVALAIERIRSEGRM